MPSNITKILDYLYLVLFNWFFLGGLVVTYVAKAYFGGPVISIVTGAVVAIVIHEVFKYVAFN